MATDDKNAFVNCIINLSNRKRDSLIAYQINHENLLHLIKIHHIPPYYFKPQKKVSLTYSKKSLLLTEFVLITSSTFIYIVARIYILTKISHFHFADPKCTNTRTNYTWVQQHPLTFESFLITINITIYLKTYFAKSLCHNQATITHLKWNIVGCQRAIANFRILTQTHMYLCVYIQRNSSHQKKCKPIQINQIYKHAWI